MQSFLTINRGRLLSFFTFGLFFHMFFLSSEYILTKLIFFVVTFSLLSKKAFILNTDTIISFFVLITISLISFLVGLVENSIEGVIDEFKTYIFWPSVIFAIFSIKYSINDCRRVLVIFSGFVLYMPMIMAIFLIAYLAGAGNYLKFPSGVEIAGIGINEGSISIYLININFLIFGSFLIITATIFNRISIFGASKVTIILALCSYIFIFLISGRKGWYLSMLFVVILSLIWNYSEISGIKLFSWFFLMVIFVVSLINFANIDMGIILETLINSFDPNSGGVERYEQFNAMIYALQDRLALGYGLGSAVEGSIRNIDKPWHYELTYIKLIFNIGLPLSILFMSICVYLMIRLVILKSDFGFIFVSILGYIIISATNPYLSNFDTMWVVFLPVLLLNYYKVGHDIVVAPLNEMSGR